MGFSMPNEVANSIASLFTDLGATRRADKKGEAPAENGQGEREGALPFGQLVSAERRTNEPRRPAHVAVRRGERMMPGQLGREARKDAQFQRKAASDDTMPLPEATKWADRDTRSSCIGTAPAERPACEGHSMPRPVAEADSGADPSLKQPNEVKSGESCQGPAETHAGIAQKPAAEVQADESPACFGHAGPAGEIDIQVVAAEISAAEIFPAIVVPGTGAASQQGSTDGTSSVGSAPVSLTISANATIVAATAVVSTDALDEEGVAGDTGDGEGGEAEGVPGLRTAHAGAGEGGEAKPALPKQGIGEEVSALAKDIAKDGNGKTGEAGEGKETKASPPNLHPTRANPFRELLEGFTHPSAIHRPADILAGLDRSVAAAAVNNRGHEIQRPTPLQMLPIEIGMQAVRGVTNFQIRLDPAELGRVDVHLQIRDNGEVNASLVVDRVETLAMLKRDASTLQYAFEQAGLRQSADGLNFSLRGENQQGQQQGEHHRGGHAAHDDPELQAQISEVAMRRAMIPNSSVDLMV